MTHSFAAVLNEDDKEDLQAAAGVLLSLLKTGSADPDDVRFVGFMMLELADRFEEERSPLILLR